MIFTIAARELRSLFLSPLAWAMLAVMQFILGLIFAKGIDVFLAAGAQAQTEYGITRVIIETLYFWTSIIVMIVIPLLTMRVFSEEKRNATFPLLMSAPISLTEIAMGKYLALLGFNSIFLSLVTTMPMTVLIGGGLDFGQLAAATTGLFLIMAAYTALGLYISSLTKSPVLAAVLTYLAIIFLFIIDLLATNNNPTGLFSYISLRTHLVNFLQGLFSTKDAVSYTHLTLPTKRIV